MNSTRTCLKRFKLAFVGLIPHQKTTFVFVQVDAAHGGKEQGNTELFNCEDTMALAADSADDAKTNQARATALAPK